jgi:chromosome segregation ATPase
MGEVAEPHEPAARLARLERELAEIGEREGALSTALIDAHDQLLRRDREISDLHEAVAHTQRQQEEIRRHEEEIGRLHAQLAEVLESRPMRLHRRLMTLPGIRWMRRRRVD